MNRIEEIREREKKATKGPWKVEVDSERIVGNDGFYRSYYFAPEHLICELGPKQRITEEQAIVDGEFAAYSRDDIPYLLARLSAAEDLLRDAAKISFVFEAAVAGYFAEYSK